jgi:hypothetical protein
MVGWGDCANKVVKAAESTDRYPRHLSKLSRTALSFQGTSYSSDHSLYGFSPSLPTEMWLGLSLAAHNMFAHVIQELMQSGNPFECDKISYNGTNIRAVY